MSREHARPRGGAATKMRDGALRVVADSPIPQKRKMFRVKRKGRPDGGIFVKTHLRTYLIASFKVLEARNFGTFIALI